MVRSTTALVDSRPTLSVTAARPAATSSRSTTSSDGSSPSLPTRMWTPASSTRTAASIEAGARDDLDAPLGECPLHLLRDLGVLERHDRRQVLQDGHLGTQVAVVGRELHAHRAAADDRDGRGHIIRLEDVVAGHDPDAVGHEPGQALDPRAGGQDRVLAGEHALAGRLVVGIDGRDADGASRPPASRCPGCSRPCSCAPGSADPCGAAPPPGRRRSAMATGSPCASDTIEPVLVRLADLVQQVGRLEHRLGRDAATMEARAADLVLVDERDPQAQLARHGRRRSSRRCPRRRRRGRRSRVRGRGRGVSGHGSRHP